MGGGFIRTASSFEDEKLSTYSIPAYFLVIGSGTSLGYSIIYASEGKRWEKSFLIGACSFVVAGILQKIAVRHLKKAVSLYNDAVDGSRSH